MKFKNLLVLIVLLMTVFTTTVSFAGNREYLVKEADMTVEIPDDMYVFTRDTAPDDENLKELGFSYDGLKSSFELASIYLEAVDSEDFSEILVIVEDSTDKDTNKFVRVKSDSAAQYETHRGGKKITVKFVSYAGKHSDEVIEEYENIVENIRFGGKNKLPIADATDNNDESADSAGSAGEGSEIAGGSDKNDEIREESESRSYDKVTYCVIIIGAVMAILIIITRIIKKR